jgi:outer membrane receptor protein involved in Fe transport
MKYLKTITSVLITSAVAFSASGQDDQEQIFELAEFRVDASSDVGYLATNSVSGTRLRMEIRDLPMPLEVINSEFMRDTGATNFDEALAYSSGAFVSLADAGTAGGSNQATAVDRSPSASAGVGNFRNNAISIRGFNVPFQQRNGFRIGGFIPTWGVNLGGITDTVSMERIEVVRGPQALLYGISVLSGIANILPKYPLAEQRQEFSLAFGSDGYVRGTGDITGPTFVENLNYRGFFAVERGGDWTDYRFNEKDYFGFQLEYQPTRKVTLFTEFQYADQLVKGIGAQTVRDTITEAHGRNQDFRNPFNEFVEWARDPDYGNLPNSYRFTGRDTYYNRKEWNLMFDAEVRPFEGLTFKSGFFGGRQDIEEFTVRAATVTTQEGSFNVRNAAQSGLIDQSLVTTFPHPDDPNPTNPNPLTSDFRLMRYWWVKNPTKADNIQFRNELSYQWESTLFGQSLRHSILLGRQDIQDKIDFTNRNESFSNVFWFQNSMDLQPYSVRNLFDFEPMRYQGEILAQPGDDYLQTRLWFTGHYGVYSGQYFNNRITLIAGLRHDRYNTWEAYYDRVSWRADSGVDPTRPETLINPNYDFNQPNQLIGFDQSRPPRHLFDQAQTETTPTLALSGRFNDALSGYVMYAEGVSPNTGQVDGADVSIPAERTKSREIGLKFDFFDRKISGTISVFQIKRENATWDYVFAPNPKNWATGSDAQRRGSDPTRLFDPRQVESGVAPISYGVERRYLDERGISFRPFRDPDTNQVVYPDGILGVTSNVQTGEQYVWLVYDRLDEAGLREVMDAAFNDLVNVEDFTPINYGKQDSASLTGQLMGNNPSNGANIQGGGRSSFVTFEDESKGVDMQLILSPRPHWQFIINYAYIERKTTSPFNLVDAKDQESGISYGTEYDLWSYWLGQDSFEDPTDPTTLTDGGILGTSLYMGANHSASMWTRYTIQEGPLEKLGLGLGIIYTGSAQTSVPIGSRQLLANPYRTPERPERFRFDAALSYRTNWRSYELDFRLNVYNIFNHTASRNFAHYTNQETGAEEVRRTQAFFAPRSFRASVTISF